MQCNIRRCLINLDPDLRHHINNINTSFNLSNSISSINRISISNTRSSTLNILSTNNTRNILVNISRVLYLRRHRCRANRVRRDRVGKPNKRVFQ